MLDLRSRLEFPRLVALTQDGMSGETIKNGKVVGSWKDSKKNLYKLDWDVQEKRLQENRTYSASRITPTPVWAKYPLVPSLPEPYDEILKATRFAITQKYLDEIHRNARRALLEWNQRRPFDTCIRESCLETTDSHVWVAFRLLADCVWDENLDRFSRDEWKYHCIHAMVFKFWCHQTGDGLLVGKARLRDLEDRIDRLKEKTMLPIKGEGNEHNEILELEHFVSALKQHQYDLCHKGWRVEQAEALKEARVIHASDLEVSNMGYDVWSILHEGVIVGSFKHRPHKKDYVSQRIGEEMNSNVWTEEMDHMVSQILEEFYGCKIKYITGDEGKTALRIPQVVMYENVETSEVGGGMIVVFYDGHQVGSFQSLGKDGYRAARIGKSEWDHTSFVAEGWDDMVAYLIQKRWPDIEVIYPPQGVGNHKNKDIVENPVKVGKAYGKEAEVASAAMKNDYKEVKKITNAKEG